MEIKDIENRKYERMIKRALRGKKIDPAFKEVLPEIFLRRVYELGLSEKEFRQDLKNFSRSVDTIRFADESTFKSPNIMGHQDSYRKEICINRDFFAGLLYKGMDCSKVSEKIFGTLTHELFHAMTNDEYGLAGLRYYGNDGKIYGSALDEVFVETTSNRCSVSRTAYDAEHYRSETDGYGDITFASNILAATFGKTEKAVLKAASRGRSELVNCLLEGVPNPEKSINTFYAIEQNLDMLYQLNYDNSSLDRRQNQNLRAQALGNMYAFSLGELNNQIEDTKCAIKNPMSFVSSYIYRKDKIKGIMRDTMSKYENIGYIDSQDKNRINYNVNIEAVRLSEKLYDMDTVLKNTSCFRSQDEYFQAFYLAKDNKIRQYSDWYRNELGLNINLNNHSTRDITSDNELEMFVLKEDFDNGRQWNNYALVNKMNMPVYNELTTKSKFATNVIEVDSSPSIFDKIRGAFRNLFGRNQTEQEEYSYEAPAQKGEVVEFKNQLDQYHASTPTVGDNNIGRTIR